MFARAAIGCCICLGVVVWSSIPARADPSFIPPVDAAVSHSFEAPATEFGPGHRGIDFAVAGGTRVRAAAAGTVAFAGRVAGELAISIDHGAGMTTTYSRLAEVWVGAGDVVTAGTWLGLTGRAHPGVGGLHFGVKLAGAYVDPRGMFGPVDLGGALRLTPLLWEPSSEVPEALAAALRPTGPGDGARDCSAVEARRAIARPPNDNVAIAVAGIGSKTLGADAADMYEPGPAFFGYDPARTYLFSYRGVRGSRLHRDYERTDTYGDIESAARKLGALVRAVGRAHPGAGVDLIAHSQGGIVARTYLARRAAGDEGGGPPVEHLVTFASPHSGAPVAANVPHLRERTVTGPALLAFASAQARAQRPIPDPNAPAVEQLAPDSGLMTSLAAQDVTFGTRVLNLGIPNDAVVPADRTAMPGGLHRIVPPRGALAIAAGRVWPGNGHGAIVTSPVARGLVHDFLRGAAPSCPTVWDPVGRTVGRVVSWAHARLGDTLSVLEGPAGRTLVTVRDLVGKR